VLDVNHLYRSNGAPCAGEACWGATLVRLSAPAADACARGAPVAIVDTAVDPTHPTLKGAAIAARSFLPEGVDPAPADHGTAVAALLVGRVAPGAPPLAPGAKLLAAEAFALRDGRLRADAAAVVRALDWTVGARARVVGLSLAGPGNAVLERAVAAAGRRASLVAAAGNDGPRAGPAYPAAYPAVIAVAALDSRKRVWRGGNRGAYVEIAAPGVDVVSAAPGGGTTAWTGTSFAVPFAVAAVMRARAEAGGDPEAARALLARSAEDIGAPGRDDASGHGLARAPGARCF
jgi:subtilisin family serine protease